MTVYTFASHPVVDPATGSVVTNATGGKLVSAVDGAALPITDLNGNPLASITTGRYGQSAMFKATDVYRGFIQFGAVAVGVVAMEVADDAVAAQGAIATANQVASDVAALEDRVDNLSAGVASVFRGAVASESAMIGLTTAARGDWCNRTDVQARFDLVASDPTNPANWARNLGGGGVGSPTWATMPAGAEGKVVGLSTATRPTTRTDVFFRWQTTDGIYPVSALPGDVWENAVEA